MNVVVGLVFMGFILWGFASLLQWLGRTMQKGRLRIAVDAKKNIVARNEDIINRACGNIYDDHHTYYIENTVKNCIAEIAKREGRPHLAPAYREWLSAWECRPDIPPEYQELKQQLKSTFQARLDQIQNERKQRQAEIAHAAQLIAAENVRRFEADKARDGQALYHENKDLIGKFLEIAERKVSILDDYGDENWSILGKEIEACLAKIAQRKKVMIGWQEHYASLRSGGDGLLPHSYSWLREKLDKAFREYHELQRREPSTVDVHALDGVAFETYVARRLKESGYDDVRGTPVTGDQGADLIAKKDGRTIIIQAKRYQGTVGNKAVQEVNSDEGWVITNSTFTQSARALAQKTNVRLFEGRDLERLSEILRSNPKR